MGRPRKTHEDFLEKVELRPDGCWLWTGKLTSKGYAQFCITTEKRRYIRAAAYSFEYYNRELLPGEVPDHLCRNRWCVNPDCLEAVTDRENVARGESFTAKNARKTRCPRGHKYDKKTTKNRRYCSVCKRKK